MSATWGSCTLVVSSTLQRDKYHRFDNQTPDAWLMSAAALRYVFISRRWRPCAKFTAPHLRSSFLFAVLMATALCGAGCTTTNPVVSIWQVRGEERDLGFDLRESHGELISVAGSTIRLSGAINEVLDFEIGLRASSHVIDAALEFELLRCQSTGHVLSAAKMYRVHRVPVPSWPGWHIRTRSEAQREPNPWDVLVPIDAPIDGMDKALKSGETYRYWVDIPIPKGTPPGEYVGRLALMSQGQNIASIDVQVTVWPFVLPDNLSPVFIADVDLRSLVAHHRDRKLLGERLPTHMSERRTHPARQQLESLLAATLRMLHDHRISPTLSGLSPMATPRGDGSLSVDWQEYDDIVTPILSGQLFSDRLAQQFLPISMSPVEAAWQTGLRKDRASPTVSRLVEAYLSQAVAHLQQRGWLAKSYLPLAPNLTAELSSSKRLGDLVPALRENLGPLSLLSNRSPQDLTPYGWVGYPANSVASLVDILMPPAQFYDAATMATQRAQGKRTWFAMDRPPYSGTTAIEGCGADVRILAWQGLRLQAQVVHLGVVNVWPANPADSSPNECLRADARSLIFPGSPFGLSEPVPTVRLKRLRQGLQDVAYLQLMYDQGLGHVATTLLETLSPPSGASAYRSHFADGEPIRWPSSIQSFEAAKHVMANELLRRLHLSGANQKQPEASQKQLFVTNAKWRRLMMTMRRVELSVEGVRVRDAGSPHRTRTELTCVVRIVNRSRAPVSGKLRFRQLPDQWQSSGDHRTIERLLPDESKLIRLSASLPTSAFALLGAPPMDIEFVTENAAITDDTAQVTVVAPISVTMAQPFDRPIAIDGDLTDWPSSVLNVASAYTPISGSMPGELRDPGRPLTLAFFARDHEYLYIALNCTLSRSRRPPTERGKRIVYDDLIPVGEDLVEILIDPLNSESRSPGDLYHVVVKYSGVDLAEKGIATTPPCCAHEPWPVKIDIESRVSPGLWTTELRLPLADLGIGPADSAIVGLNITRFDAERENYYTWSGATQTAYDPLSLGNLFIPAMPVAAGR